MDIARTLLPMVVGILTTLVSGLYRSHEAVIDASFDNYGFPLPWLVYSEGFGLVVPVRWTFNWAFFTLDVVLYAAIANVAFWVLAKSKLFRK